MKASLAGVSEAAAGAARNMPDDFRVSITNAPGKDTYPISSFTWLLIPAQIQDAQKRDIIKGFLKWMLTDGQGYCEALSYAKLPAPVVTEGTEGDLAHPVRNECIVNAGIGQQRMEASTTVGPAGVGWHPRALLRRLRSGDAIAHAVTLIFAATILLITVLLVYQLWVNSAPSRAKFGLDFLYTSTWDPVFDNFGALPFLYGTVVTTVFSLLIAVPLGTGSGDFSLRAGSSKNVSGTLLCN